MARRSGREEGGRRAAHIGEEVEVVVVRWRGRGREAAHIGEAVEGGGGEVRGRERKPLPEDAYRLSFVEASEWASR